MIGRLDPAGKSGRVCDLLDAFMGGYRPNSVYRASTKARRGFYCLPLPVQILYTVHTYRMGLY
ncbi:Uncharacterized protein APZ42_032812 [Daphnia magna]|uniref:Uncharacterized protein n=1 Tax=Daphnia magna TaxID=35525 RepID=A0A0P6C5Z4_9CRUS|nr:Uncharacterized protein APZ42_032812 [Daphnia magna]